MKKSKRTGLFLAAVGSAAGVGAQGVSESDRPSPLGSPLGAPNAARLGVSASFDGWFPGALEPDPDVSYALGGTAQVSYAALPFVEALGRAGVYSMTLASNESMLYIGGSAGLGFVARLFERISVGVSGHAGLGKVTYDERSVGLYELGARLEASFRLSAAMTLGISAGYERLANPNTGPFLDAVSAGIRLKLSPEETSRDRVNLVFQKVQTQAIFPVFRSWYDSEPLGSVTIRNDEDGPIDNVRVSFFAPEYMGGPRLCTTVERLERGQSVTVPLYAVFDERVLTLTENGATSAEISAEYSFLGSKREAREGLALSLHHRNAMSWEDDRRAAAFVSPTDPAALWFSRYASSVVRDRMRSELPPNLQYALGIFESLKLYGLNYVIDPNSAYIEMSANEAVIDYLQYPSQTLMYRGGDCDDLSILYCSLLESSGIPTAFITIPGHIYMAFDLGLSEAEAREKFFDPGLLLFRDGRAWAPIEITMVKEGFVKAWRVGAKQWIDNSRVGSAAFFAMKDNWLKYKPSGLQDAAARFALPDEAKAMAAFDAGVDRFVSREMEPIVAEYEKKLAGKREPEVLNEYGMAMAKVGMLDPAWERFAEASKAGYAWAWNNLASIAYVRKDYELAYSYYEWTTTLLPGDPVAVLGMARCAYELDRYSESAILYEGLRAEAPALAVRYGYLASAYGGSGRAWSMADRLAGSVWSKPGLSFELPAEAAAPVTPAVAIAPPPPVAATIAPVEVPAPIASEVSSTVSSDVARGSAVIAAPEAEPEPLDIALLEPERGTAVVAAPEPAPEAAPEPAVMEALPELETEQAVVAAPEPAPESAQELTQEPAKDLAKEPALVEAPAPVAVPAPEAKPRPTSTVEALAAVKATVATPKSSAPVAPPSVIEKPPEDVEIASKAAEAADAATIVPPPVAIALPSATISTPTRTEPIERPAAIAAPNPTLDPVATPSPVTTPVAATEPITEAPSAEDAEREAIEAARAAARALAAASKSFATAAPTGPIAAVVEPTAELAQEAPVETVPEAVAPIAAVVSPELKPEVAPSIAKAEPQASAPIAPPPPPVAEERTRTPKPRFAPASSYTPTVDRGGAPALGKRLPEGADASGYVPAVPAVPAVPTVPATLASVPVAPPIDLTSSLTRVANGSWERTESKASMSDPKAMYAKLVVATPGLSGPAAYEFKARAAGSGWVGFGMHLHGRGDWRLSGYGGGDSILVWVTSDPKTYGDAAPRLQVYRSKGDVAMPMLASVKLPGSAFELRDYRIEYDPASGLLVVLVDGERSLEVAGLTNPAPSDFAALRALDLAEFSDVRITPLNASPKASEKTP